jgi:hypothetical protein
VLTCFCRAEIVSEWDEVSNASVEETNDAIYTDWNPARRNRVEDLNDLPVMNSDEEENNIYTADGWRIPRRYPSKMEQGGVMARLRGLDSLFFGGDSDNFSFENEDGEILNRGPRSAYYVYPQAGTREYGHVQSHSIPDVFKPYLRDLNKKVTEQGTIQIHRPYDSENDDDFSMLDSSDHSEDYLADFILPHQAITATAIQMYSKLLHRARLSTADHDAQQGQLTGYLGGAYTRTDPEKSKLNKIQQGLLGGLPHQRFSEKISGDQTPREWRVEVNYDIHIGKLKEEYRTGR